jgi:hypothetical protein
MKDLLAKLATLSFIKIQNDRLVGELHGLRSELEIANRNISDLCDKLVTAEMIRDAAREASARDLEARRQALAKQEHRIEYKHLYHRAGGGYPKAHTQCGQFVAADQVCNLVGDLAGVRIFACCVAAIGAE